MTPPSIFFLTIYNISFTKTYIIHKEQYHVTNIGYYSTPAVDSSPKAQTALTSYTL